MVALGDKIVVKRKILGLPVLLFIAILLIAIGAIAGTVLLFTTITLRNAQEVNTNMPQTLDATAGSYYEWNWSIENKANRDSNFTLRLSITPNSTTLTNNEIRLLITDENDTILAESLTPTNATYQEAVKTDYFIQSSEIKRGKIKLEFNLSAENDTYYLKYSVEPGTFSWKY
jgi:hypothetical protein